LLAMARYGGVWINASAVPMQPLEAWVDMSSAALVQGFTVPSGGEIMDTFAFAAPAGSPFVAAWLAEYEHALLTNATAASIAPPPANFESVEGYLLQHACFSAVRTRDFAGADVRLLPSYVAGGPLSLQHACGTYGTDVAARTASSACVATALFNTSQAALASSPFVMLSDAERAAMRPLGELEAHGSWLAGELLDAIPADLVRVAYQPAERPYRDPIPALWLVFGIIGIVLMSVGALGGLGWLAMRYVRPPPAASDEKRAPLTASSS